MPLLRVMAERLPNVTVHLVEAMTGYLDELIQAGRLDVALLYDHKAFEHVAWTEMITEDLYVVRAQKVRSPNENLFRSRNCSIFRSFCRAVQTCCGL